MTQWIATKNDTEKDAMLDSMGKGMHWPHETKKGKGKQATDFRIKVWECVRFMYHSPVIRKEENGTYNIVPLHPLPEGLMGWKDVIGFDPITDFDSISIGDSYQMNIWACTGCALRHLDLPEDPDDSSRKLPHNSIIKFIEIPMMFIPNNLLRIWLFYRGVPHPKNTTQQNLLEQVELAIQIKKSLDYSRIDLNDAMNTRSYISWGK